MLKVVCKKIGERFQEFDGEYCSDGSNYKTMIYLIGFFEGLLISSLIAILPHIIKTL